MTTTKTIIIDNTRTTTTTSTTRRRMQAKSSTSFRLFAIMLILAIFSFSANTLFVSATGLEQPASEQCTDLVTFFSNKKNEDTNMCEWVAKGKDKRTRKLCNENKKKRKKEKLFGEDVSVKGKCPCTCDNDRFSDGTTDTDDGRPPRLTDVCPDNYDANSECSSFEDQLTCNYDYTWDGCTEDTSECRPIVSCTCNESGDNKWSCLSEARESCDTPGPTRVPKEPQERNKSLLRTLREHTVVRKNGNHHDTGEGEHLRRAARRRDLTEESASDKNGDSCDLLNLD